ncbi:hypothetical protein [Nonomuraea guangzhouensis]|uniref:Uncharacterized protein n=1 Tax=Nonomuraea guangzhouensis TaxID=1291555 RepID=A0ABW4GW12_9ACTN|nr:hypothetical protein [Nonomuraea guangzhouensis]
MSSSAVENCWILAYDSDGTQADNGEFVPHFTTEAEARKRADGAWAAEGGVAPGYFAYTTPRQLDQPCLIVKCGCCGKAYDEEGEGRSVHFETVEDARAVVAEDEWTVLEDGTYRCEPCTVAAELSGEAASR